MTQPHLFLDAQARFLSSSVLGRANAAALVFLLVGFPIARIVLQLYLPGGGTHLATRLFTGSLEVIVITLALGDRNVMWPRWRAFPRWASWLSILWLAWSVPSIALADAPAVAAIRQLEWVFHGLLGVAVWAYLTAYPDWRAKLLRCIVLGFLLYGVVITYVLLQVSDPGSYPWTAGILGFGNVRHFGHFATIALVAAYAPLVAGGRERRDMMVSFCVLTVIYAFLVWSGGRGPFLGLACAFLILLIARRIPDPRCLMLASGVAFVLGALISIPFTPPDSSFGALRFLTRSTIVKDANSFSSGRAVLWEKSVRIIEQHPLFGLGPDQYRETLGASPTIFFHPHNGLLQAILEWGMPGGVVFWGIVFGLMIAGWRRLATHRDPETLIGFGLVLTLLIVSMVSGTLYFAMPLSALSLGCALMFSGRRTISIAGIDTLDDAS